MNYQLANLANGNEHLYSMEQEEAVFSCIFTNPAIFGDVLAVVTADDFFLLRHNYIFKAMERLYRDNKPPDYQLVCEELKSMGKLEDIGGVPYLTKLTLADALFYHAVYYAADIARHANRRRLFAALDEGKAIVMNPDLNPDEVNGEVLSKILDAVERREDGRLVNLTDAMSATIDKVDERYALYHKNPGYTLGVKTGLQSLDTLIDGLQTGVNVLAAATGMGKTALVLTIALNASRYGIDNTEKRGAKVVMFSGEMSQDQLNYRLGSILSGIDEHKIRRGALNDSEYQQLMRSMKQVSQHNIKFKQATRVNPAILRAMCRRLKNRNDIDLLILDGLLQIDPDNFAKEKRLEIEKIMDGLEDIALESDIPILLTHQISRASASRQDKRPVLADLAEASFVEQKSARVIFLYRDSYYGITTDSGGGTLDPADAELIVAKNRFGLTGKVKVRWVKEQTKFEG